MNELRNTQYLLYIQALKNPSELQEEDLLQLIVRYPYSQPLIFAYERRKAQRGEASLNKSLALLYSPSSSWLWTFLNSNLSEVKDKLVQEFISSDELLKEVESSMNVARNDNPELEKEFSEEIILDDQTLYSNEEEKDELDILVSQGSVMVDFFVFDRKTEGVSSEVLVNSLEEEDPENISLYNDDLMPYSFKWWLQKTRQEYADTYQPFVLTNLVNSNSKTVDFGKLDDSILDQQIKQHIIHFQDPEAKLSDQVKGRVLEEVQPKRTDPIIERFIREEPVIQAPSAEKLNNENMARQSAEDNYMLVTETLANVYKDQGLFQKAIEVFDKLILKYPEKKSYFASRIHELEKNI